MSYVEEATKQQKSLRDQLTHSLADKQKNLIPANTKLTIPVPSGLDPTGAILPKTFTCVPDFEKIQAALPTLPSMPLPNLPSMSLPDIKLPSLPSLPGFPNLPTFPKIEDWVRNLPASFRNTELAKLFSKYNMQKLEDYAHLTEAKAQEFKADVIAKSMEYKKQLEAIPIPPAIKQLEQLKTFCKPPSEAPASNTVMPKVKETTKTITVVDEKGVSKTETVVEKTVTTPMDEKGVNAKAQVKIVGEITRQSVVQELIDDINLKISLVASYAPAFSDLTAFYLHYADVNNFPSSSDGWQLVYNELMLKINNCIAFYEVLHRWYYAWFKKMINPSKNPKKWNEIVAGESSTNFISGANYTNVPEDIGVYGLQYDFLDSEYNKLFDIFKQSEDSLYNKTNGVVFNSLHCLNIIDLKATKRTYEDLFDKYKCEMWKLSGTDNDFSVLMSNLYGESITEKNTASMLKTFMSENYSNMHFTGDYEDWNYKAGNFDMITSWTQTSLTILVDVLSKSLPPKG